MTQEHRMSLPERVVREDRQLESAAESASVALGELRWHWTLDESNPNRVSFRGYAQQVGRNHGVIFRFAKAYEVSVRGDANTFAEAYERVNMSAAKQAIVEAVAEANHTSFPTARKAYDEVNQVRNAVEREADRREERSEPFPIEERQDYAKKVAEAKKRTREREAREREESRKKHNARFFEADTVVGSVRRRAKEAFDLVEGVEFTEEEVELLTRQLDAAEHMIRLLRMRVTGESGVDWDAELAELEEKRQYG